MNETKTKTCTKCGEEKPLSEFSVDRGKPRSRCKKCGVKYSKMWAEENKDKSAKNKLRYYLKNRSTLYENHKSRRKSASDSYCREILKQKRGFLSEQITPELIGVQRNVIKIKRLAKEIQK